jgi:S-(hydroxymethyl)glutathione dehydrogenase/alcohol dehydrogenase
MKAAILHQVGKPLVIEDVMVSKPGPHEVLVRTMASGVCHSDLHMADGSYPSPLPIILGHEAAGIVEQVGTSVRGIKPGDHVVTCVSAFCGHCEQCLTGHMARCDTADSQRDPSEGPRLSLRSTAVHQFANLSAYAEYMLIHEHACVSIRKDMPFDRAAVIGCAVTTGVGAVIHTSNVRAGETVAVLGCGGIGLSSINGAAIAGASRIIAIDTQPAKLELAKKFGATDTILVRNSNPVEEVIEMTRGGVHHAIEAIGLKSTAEQSFGMLARGGTATIVGMIPYGVKIELHGADFLSEKKIQGSVMGSNRFPLDIPRYIEFYMQGRLNLDDLVARHIKLADVNDAFDELKRGEIARSVIMFDA